MTTYRQQYKSPGGSKHWRTRKKHHPTQSWTTFKAAAIAAAVTLCCMGSQSAHAQTANIYADKNPTNIAPQWNWRTSEPVSDCQLRIQNKSGATVFDNVLNNMLRFSYADGIVHNEFYRANVRCSKDAGETWGGWSGNSSVISVDTVAPRIELKAFMRDRVDQVRVSYEGIDDLSGFKNVHLQIARDAAFNDIVFDQNDVGSKNAFMPWESLPESTYYARVAGIDKAGNRSEFSAPRLFSSSDALADMGISVLKEFTNQSPGWIWTKLDGIDTYEIEVQNTAGEVLERQVVASTNQFTYTVGTEHGKQFRARVRSSADGGTTWNEWTALSDVITVDAQTPTVQMNGFVKEMRWGELGQTELWRVDFGLSDDVSGVEKVHIQIASDSNFTDLIVDESSTTLWGYQFYPDSALLGDNYYVRVKAIDAAGNATEFTAPRKLGTAASASNLSIFAKEYTNQAPEWSWILVGDLNLYEVMIGNSQGETLYQGIVGNTNRFTYTGDVEQDGVYYAQVRGSSDGGVTWGEWFAGGGTVYDVQAPRIILDAFTYQKYYSYIYNLQMGMDEAIWNYAFLQVQIARDPQFQQLVHDEVVTSYSIFNPTIDLGPLQGNLYARVRLADTAGNLSEFTPARAIMTSSTITSIELSSSNSGHEALKWWWMKPDTMNAFEIEVQDADGDVLHTERLGDVTSFSYRLQNPVHEQMFKARVRGSTDSGATWTEWSTTNSIRVDTITPSIEVNQFLRDSENTLTIALKIDNDNYQSDLQIQVATDASFNDVVYDKTSIVYSNAEQQYINGSFTGQQYFVRTKVLDDAGNDSGFTPAIALTEDLSISKFGYVSGSINTPPQWRWNRNDKVKNYEVEVIDEKGAIAHSGTIGGADHYSLTTLFEHGQAFTARVRGQSRFNAVWGEWTEFSAPIMVDMEAPSAQLSSFVHTSATTVEFKYALADDLGPLGYLKIEVAKEPTFENLVFDQIISATSNPTVYQTALTEPGDLYARIAVFDGATNVSSYSAVAKVDTVMTSIPVMYSGTGYTKNAPIWSWSDVYNTNAYEIEIQNPSGEIVHTQTLGKVSYHVYDAGLGHGNAFRARVRGSIDQGVSWGEWSNWSGLQTVDIEPPLLGMLSFMHTGATTAEVRFTARDVLSGMRGAVIQIAGDAQFNEIIASPYIDRRDLHKPYTIKYLPEDKVLYARIMGYDNAGNASEHTPAMQIDSVVAEKPSITAQRYTNAVPQWFWDKLYMATDYEIEIKDKDGNTIVSQNIGNADHFTYTEGFVHGKEWKAKVRVSLDHAKTWSEWSYEQMTTVDTVKPVSEVLSVQYIQEDFVEVVFKVTEETTGIQSTHLQIATDVGFTQFVYNNSLGGVTANIAITWNLEGLPKNTKLYARLKAMDGAGNASDYSPAVASELSSPRLDWPVYGHTAYTSELEVRGRSVPDSKVQVYVDGEPVGGLVLTDEKGNFTTILILTHEGANAITATVQNNLGVSEPSDVRQVNYKIPVPSGAFVKPSSGSTVAAPILIEVNASDILGVEKVEFYDGDVLLGSVTQVPYQQQWDVRFSDNGTHNLKAVVTNTSGKQVSIEQTVKVDVAPEKPVIPPTPYTGKVESVTPAVSYGSQPIRITGTAIDRTTSSPMANRPLKLVLSVHGFERTINMVTDATGAFSYRFVPQSSDKGTYQVSVIHPDEVEATPQGSFNINLASFNVSGYKLAAARNFPAQFSVTATANGNVQGLRWVVLAEDQPSGTLPKGIVINGGSGLDIAEGKSASMPITVTADATATETGVIYLRAVSEDSGDLVRGTLRVDYKLMEVQSFLSIQKNSIQTGVKQGESVSETIVLSNKGLIAAQNVRAQLQDEHGNPPPSWMFLANEENVGAVKVGEEVSVQVTAQPGVDIADGIYRFKLHVSADNGAQADAFISVAVTQSGIGGVRFDVADIYTATLGEDGQPIPGVKGVTIKLQNEVVLSEQYEATTGSDGTALLEELPPGIYLFRASASNHKDISGRVRIRPGVITDQHIFLSYELINIEFGVTETTIQDVYDIVLEATYQTQVPAPVVLLEPMSINLGGMQAGEERTGQLTLTNYGLIEAQEVNFTPPQSDSEFKYEFFADIPDRLPPKTRIVIPYRVTALGDTRTQGDDVQGRSGVAEKLLMAKSTRAGNCTPYTNRILVGYTFECINGEWQRDDSSAYYVTLKGESCTGNGITWGGGWGWGWGGGSGGGGWGTPGSSIPLVDSCTPDCQSSTICKNDGESSGDGNDGCDSGCNDQCK